MDHAAGVCPLTPKLVIFDCDGVLVDTEGPVNDLIATNLSSHGLQVSGAQSHALFVGGTMESAGAEAERLGATLPDNWIDQIYAAIFARLRAGVDVIPGVVDLLDKLAARGVETAVASNGPMAKMKLSLGPSGLFERFSGRIYSREDHAPKPAPDMLLHAMQVAGATADQTVMIDDSPSGCAAAKAAGVRCLGFASEGQDTLLAAQGAEPVRSMAEVARALGVS